MGPVPAEMFVTRWEEEYIFPAAMRVALSLVSVALDYYTWPLQMFVLFSVFAE